MRTGRLPRFLVVLLFVGVVLGFTAHPLLAVASNSTPSPAPAISPSEEMGGVLYNNGPFVTNTGGGPGGSDLSVLQNTSLGMTIFGFGNNGAAGFRMADGFTIPAGETWNINSIQFFNYQTGSTTTSTMTGVTVRIWDGPPNSGTSTVVFGDTTTNRLAASTWTNAYRVAENAQTGTTRPVMQNTATISTTLSAGTYWVDYGTTGSLASGPWAVPITIVGQTTTGDALQFNGTTWAAALDGTFPQGVSFVIEGSQVAGGSITLDKTVGTDSSTCATTDSINVVAGSTVYYCYEVTNTGPITYTFHDLEDSELGTILSGFPFTLVPGASAFLTVSTVITETTVNTGTWTAYNLVQLGNGSATATDTATVNVVGATSTPTPTASNTPVPPTSTPTATATPGGGGNRFCSSTAITIPDANPTGATGTITVGSAGTISDLNVIITGTHTWVGDIRLNLSNGTTNVTFYDQPGVPASTFGCSGDNLPGVIGDDEGVNGSFENSCQNATPAYTPGGSYTNNNALSAFDGSATNATWTLTASDLAAGDTGSITGWCVEFATGAGPTPTATPTAGQVPDINLNPGSFNETHSSPPQTTTDTLNIQNVGTGALNWTIVEDDSRPFANPNPVQPRTTDAVSERLGSAGGATISKLELGPIVGDGSFETGTPNASWEEFSTNFGTPLCDAVCGTGGGTGPRTGAWWAWFGGTTSAETGIITQTVTIPSGSAELSFWLEIPATATGTNGFLSVRMDGTEVFRAEETTTGYATYAEVTVDASAYADGGAHELVFFSTTDAGAAVTNFFVDDVAITSQAGGQCTAPTDIPWLTVSPTNGSTTGGGSTPVTLTYNSTSLAQGTYTGTLCIGSNDPDEELVTVPVTLNVGPPTAIDLSSFTSPVSGFNPADLAAAGLLLLAGAVLILRRK